MFWCKHAFKQLFQLVCEVIAWQGNPAQGLGDRVTVLIRSKLL